MGGRSLFFIQVLLFPQDFPLYFFYAPLHFRVPFLSNLPIPLAYSFFPLPRDTGDALCSFEKLNSFGLPRSTFRLIFRAPPHFPSCRSNFSPREASVLSRETSGKTRGREHR